MLDIFAIEPSVVSKDLSEKSFFIYGTKKSGKTSNAVKFPKPILLGYEKGWGAIAGVRAVPINRWKDGLDVKKQLIKDAEEVRSGKKEDTFYKTVIMDTADIAYDMCEDYVLAIEGVQNLDETESKRGYRKVSREFEKFVIDIIKAGYTFVAISHDEVKQLKDESGNKYDRIMPTVHKRGLAVLARTVDIIGYSKPEIQEDGTIQTMLHMRGSQSLEAGSRWKYTSPKIPFTYEALLDDMIQAIDREEKEDGIVVVDKKSEQSVHQETELDYDKLMAEVQELGNKFVNAEKLDVFNEIAEEYIGTGKKLSQCSRMQTEIIAVAIDALNDKAEELGL